MAKKVRNLKDITTKEVSLVDSPANKKKFLFHKQEDSPEKRKTGKKLKKKINIVIDSDGTVGGTKIKVNGDALKDLKDFNFSFWSGDENDRVSCSYSILVETDDGFSRSETFQLSKGDIYMNKEIKKALETFLDIELETDTIERDDDAIEKALGTVAEYKPEFPDDLKEAVIVLAKNATQPVEIEKASDDDDDDDDDDNKDVKKAGAKFSKETLAKLQSLVNALEGLKKLLPELKDPTEKSAAMKKFEEKLEELDEVLKDAKVEKKGKKAKDDTSDDSKINKAFEGLLNRIEKVEKGTGVKKSIDGQEDDNDDDGEKKWPSFGV